MRNIRQESIDFVSNPWDWAGYPLCAMKRPKESHRDWPDFGILHANYIKDGHPRIYLTSIFNSYDNEEDLKRNFPYLDYESVSSMIKDGWLVD
jgi:hypothetical protein